MSEARRDEIFLGSQREKLEGKTILIAGVGADGSAAALPLGAVLDGVPNAKIILADPDNFSEGNIDSQVFLLDELGSNKAAATKRYLEKHFRDLEITAVEEGITPQNVSNLVQLSDYIIDATDVSVATGIAKDLHHEASRLQKPVVVPWSLGLGAASIVFKNQGEFDQWDAESRGISRLHGFEEIEEMAKWLVHLPRGASLQILRKILSGEAHTPTTYFGAIAGGHLAAKQTVSLCAGEAVDTYPKVTLLTHDTGRPRVIVDDCRKLITGSIKQLNSTTC